MRDVPLSMRKPICPDKFIINVIIIINVIYLIKPVWGRLYKNLLKSTVYDYDICVKLFIGNVVSGRSSLRGDICY